MKLYYLGLCIFIINFAVLLYSIASLCLKYTLKTYSSDNWLL